MKCIKQNKRIFTLSIKSDKAHDFTIKNDHISIDFQLPIKQNMLHENTVVKMTTKNIDIISITTKKII